MIRYRHRNRCARQLLLHHDMTTPLTHFYKSMPFENNADLVPRKNAPNGNFHSCYEYFLVKSLGDLVR